MNLITQTKVQEVTLAHQASVQFYFVPRSKTSNGLVKVGVEVTGMFFLKQGDEASFIFHNTAQFRDVRRPVEVAVGERQHHANIDATVSSNAVGVAFNEHARLSRDALVDGAVIVDRTVLSVLDKFLLSIDFEGARPVFLLDHQQRVAANNHQIDFPFSALFFIGDTNRFKHMPTVLFARSPADLCKALLSQFPGSVNVVWGVISSSFTPPSPSLCELHEVT